MKKSISGLIDIHNHTLPGVDDGSPNMGVSMEMLDIAYKEGIRGMIVTPHFHPDKSMAGYDKIKEKFVEFQEAAKSIHPDMKLYLGREIYYTSDILELLEDGSHLTIEDSRYLLVEYSPRTDFNYIRMSVNNILQSGFIPIIAHIERYVCMHQDVDFVEKIREMGAVIQVNTGSVTGDAGRTMKRFVKLLLKKHLVDVVATDAHSTGTRAPKMQSCADYIIEKFGMEYAQFLFIYNPEKIIEGKYLEEAY